MPELDLFCRNCGRPLPEDARFCPACGQERLMREAPPEPEDGEGLEQRFTFPEDTTYDQASVQVNDWLSNEAVDILDARFTLDAILLAGTMVPTVTEISIRYRPAETEKRYRLGLMLDSRTDFGLGSKKSAQTVRRQFDHWRADNPALEVAGRQDQKLTLGWSSAWVTCFFYR